MPRTSVDLPPAVRDRVYRLAKERHTSVSKVVAELTTRGLAQLDEPVEIRTHPLTGLPVISIGRSVTNDEVLQFLDEDE